MTPRTLVALVVLALLAVLPLLTQAFDQRYLLSVGTRIVIWSIAAVSLNMILGYGGLVSFGHAAFIGIGGYAVGILSAEGVQSGWIQWPVALAAAVLWAALVEGLGQQRQDGQHQKQEGGDEATRRAQGRDHVRCPNRPVGRHTSTPAIRM